MKQLIFQNKNFRIIHDTELTSSLKEYIEQPQVVIAVPELDGDRIILVEHKRPILETVLLECPGGKVDPGEDLQESVIRELEEEIGYTARAVEYVSYFYSSVGSSTEKIHIFFARQLVSHSRRNEDKLKMTPSILSLEQVRDLLTRGQLHDGKTIIALYLYLNAKLQMQANKA